MPPKAWTNFQKSRGKPWIIGVVALWVASLLSYGALAAYAGLSSRPNLWVMVPWIATTEGMRRIAIRVCFRRLERISDMDGDQSD